jgi:energy-coupling factor transport system substrate-specific component
MKKTTIVSLLTLLVLIPATLYLGTHLRGKWHYLTSTLVILEVMVPFFLRFEARRPQARELVILAVMAALAVAGRVAIPIPNFKAITGIVMITGMAFGPQAGFMTGAISAFASNFFYTQGPWTPWQMFAYGMGGFLAGLLFYNRQWKNPKIELPVQTGFAIAAVMLAVGPLLDACTIFTTGGRFSWGYALAVLAAGFPHNVIHGLFCGATVLLLSKPLLTKLNRMKIKYGMLQ